MHFLRLLLLVEFPLEKSESDTKERFLRKEQNFVLCSLEQEKGERRRREESN